ncbi:MAG: hypothetical protein JST49_08870 [Bacteroidetes bacterium]|nr:hypothetical protein [Bacteroidota bacterium]
MENLSASSIIVIAALIIVVVALLAWLVYRNMRDETNYERGMDNPKRTLERDGGEKT